MRPNVGRSPVTPQVRDGPRIDPLVSVPIANPTQPAAVAEPGPADDPPEPVETLHGFRVIPPNQFAPCAISPVVSLAISTAPASRNISTMLASALGTLFFIAAEPQVAGYPLTLMMSLEPHGMPWMTLRKCPAAVSASAALAWVMASSSRNVTVFRSVLS